MTKNGLILIVSILVVILPLIVAALGTFMLIPYGPIVVQALSIFVSLFVIMTAFMAALFFLVFGKRLRKG